MSETTAPATIAGDPAAPATGLAAGSPAAAASTRLPQAERARLRLRYHRAKHGLSADLLAERLGTSRAALYRYEHGGIVKLETVQQIAAVLGITFEQVIAPLSDAERALMMRALVPDSCRQLLDAMESAA